MSNAFPPLHEYSLAHACPTCGVQPGVDCDAPRKKAILVRRVRLLEQVGWEVPVPGPFELMHAARSDAGRRHYYQDVGNAPWPEDREPGKRYDTIAQLATKRPAVVRPRS